jgi:hypothetical protein
VTRRALGLPADPVRRVQALKAARRHVRLFIRTPLPMPHVFLHGPRWRRFLVEYERRGRVRHHPRLYDFAADVRELVCEPLQFDRVAMWADPRERL